MGQLAPNRYTSPQNPLTRQDIRRLIPRECLRLQGYYDSQIDRMIAGMSDRQLYKQAGNGVTVTVVEAIGRNLKAVDEELRLEDAVYAD